MTDRESISLFCFGIAAAILLALAIAIADGLLWFWKGLSWVQWDLAKAMVSYMLGVVGACFVFLGAYVRA